MNVKFDDLRSIQKNYASSFKNIEQLYINNGSGTMMNDIYYYMPNSNELLEIQKTLQEHLEI